MKTSTLNRWLKPLAILLVIVFIVMLLIPKELTDEQLLQIKPGMTIDQVHQLLGKPTREWDIGAGYGPPGQIVRLVLVSKGKWAMPSLSVTIDAGHDSPHSMQNIKWTGRNQLLWVEYESGKVSKTWLFPIARTGGGLQGFIDTFREHWNQWWK